MRKTKTGLLILTLFITISFTQTRWTSPFLNRSTDNNSASFLETTSTFSGTPTKILITRPVTKYGNAPLEDKWILLLCENHLYFRLNGIEAVSVIPPEALTEEVPDYMEFKQPIAVEKYFDAAKKLSADYIIYIQCEYNRLISGGQVNIGKDTDINFFGKVITPHNDKPLFAEAKQFSISKLGMRLDTFLTQVLQILHITITNKNRNFMETAVISCRGNKVKKLGEFLAAAYESEVSEWDPFIKKYKRLVKKDPDMLLGYYAGATMCEMAGQYLNGAHLSHALSDILDMSYPRSFVESCRLYRLSGKYDQVDKILGSIPPIDHLRNDITMEKAFLMENRGQVREAADMALEILKKDKNNKRAREFYKQNGYESLAVDDTTHTIH